MPAVGIDLGTTNSVVAAVNERGEATVLRNGVGEAVTPSAVWFSDDGPIVGREALERVAIGDRAAVDLFKRQMGEPGYAFTAQGRSWSAIDLSALVLAQLKRDAEAALKSAVRDAVITVPAYFRNTEREATIAAGRQAGLNVVQIINEPTAAALSYGFKAAGPERTLLVYDLGGGTFDVTLVRLGDGTGRILTSRGDDQLGGKNWDRRIAGYFAAEFEREFGVDLLGDDEAYAELLDQAEETKKRLTSLTRVDVSLRHEGNRGRYALDQQTFAAQTSDLLHRTESFVQEVLASQGLRPSAIDGVLLVGGSTRMVMVHDLIRRVFTVEPVSGVNVDESVALGAAIKANEDLLSRLTALPAGRSGGIMNITDVTNHSLGVIVENADRSAYVNSIILAKDTVVPCQQTGTFQKATRPDRDNSLEIFLTQGESTFPGDVDYLGMYVAHDIPHQENRARVEIEYAYDISGAVAVAARVQGSSRPLRITAEPLPDDVPDRFLHPPVSEPATLPMTVYLAFDLSGSMSGGPLVEAKKAARGFVERLDQSTCAIGVIAFADHVNVKLPAAHDRGRVLSAIDSLSIGEVGGGNSAHPFDDVLNLLGGGSESPGKSIMGMNSGKRARESERRYIVTLADGVWSCQGAAITSAQRCHAAGIESIAIGFGGADHNFLRQIASSDEASIFTSMTGLVDTFSNIAQVLAEGGNASAMGSIRRIT